jgi:DnaJ-class molecular chaperone
MEKKIKKICPRCQGNGYIRIPNLSVGNPKSAVAQCTMCESQGEVSYEDYSLYGATSIPSKLQ